MSTGVLHSLFPDHCGSYGPGCHLLTGNGVLGLAHLDHTKHMGPASFAPYIVDYFLACEPAVNKQIIEAEVVNRRPVEHLLHVGNLALEVFLLSFFHVGFCVTSLAVSCIYVLLGKPLRSGGNSSFLSLKGEVNEHLCAPVGSAEEQPLMAENTATACYMRVNTPEHLALATCLGHIGIVGNHTDGIFGVLGIGTHGNIGGKFLVDIAENVAPVNPVIGKNAIEHILMAIKERLKRAADIVRCILDREERKEKHHLDHLGTGELAVGFLFKSHLPFSDVYGSKNVHNPLYAEPAATFREKIAQLRNYLPIFVHARCIFVFSDTKILKINEIYKYFRDFQPSFFRLIFTCET